MNASTSDHHEYAYAPGFDDVTTTAAVTSTSSCSNAMILSHVPSAAEISIATTTTTPASSSSSSSAGGDASVVEENLSSDASSSERSLMMDPFRPHSIAEHEEEEEDAHEEFSFSSCGAARDGTTADSTAESPVSSLLSKKRKSEPSLPRRSRSFSGSTGRDPIKKRKVVLEGETSSNDVEKAPAVSQSIQLLAQPEDIHVLSPLHVFIRQQIEVFCATPQDIAQPSPGRKIAIQEHQVGLRCIHCRHLKDRVKRATCYPTSVSRIYHSVNDMKFDHFRACPLPAHVRATLEALKKQEEQSPNSSRVRVKKPPVAGMSSSTAQYYHDSARKLGMVDGKQRVYLSKSSLGESSTGVTAATSASSAVKCSNVSNSTGEVQLMKVHPLKSCDAATTTPLLDTGDLVLKGLPPHLNGLLLPDWKSILMNNVPPKTLTSTLLAGESTSIGHPQDAPQREQEEVRTNTSTGSGSILMAQPDDPQHLNPLHCFVRRRIELFSATEQDVASPCPGRKTRVHVGQVGLRCIRCAQLPFVERVKRAVCYPPSIKGIYHAVSNMKYDHFLFCRGLTGEERAEFDSLRDAVVVRKSKDAGDGVQRKSTSSSSSSTSRFYTQSALRLGLVDTKQGIRFQTTPNASTLAESSDVDMSPSLHPLLCEPVGMTALMLAATDAGLREAFEKSKAV